jgi:hypothetical protein
MTEIDEGPEWGYCTRDGCHEAAEPVWLNADYPDDAELMLFLCHKHIGAYIYELQQAAGALLARIDQITTQDFERGGERAEREALRRVLEKSL